MEGENEGMYSAKENDIREKDGGGQKIRGGGGSVEQNEKGSEQVNTKRSGDRPQTLCQHQNFGLHAKLGLN